MKGNPLTRCFDCGHERRHHTWFNGPGRCTVHFNVGTPVVSKLCTCHGWSEETEA